MEINFSFGPNCLSALAAQGSAALSLSSPRRYGGLGPPHPPHSCILYPITHVGGPQWGLRGFGELLLWRQAEGTHCWYLSGRDLAMLTVTVWYLERASVTQTPCASGVLHHCWMLRGAEEFNDLMMKLLVFLSWSKDKTLRDSGCSRTWWSLHGRPTPFRVLSLFSCPASFCFSPHTSLKQLKLSDLWNFNSSLPTHESMKECGSWRNSPVNLCLLTLHRPRVWSAVVKHRILTAAGVYRSWLLAGGGENVCSAASLSLWSRVSTGSVLRKQFLFGLLSPCTTSLHIPVSKNGPVTFTSECRHHIWKSVCALRLPFCSFLSPRSVRFSKMIFFLLSFFWSHIASLLEWISLASHIANNPF